MTAKGKITINPEWDMTDRRRVALERLSELGVSVRSHIGRSDFLLDVPRRTATPEYIEIGYLMAQLGDEKFPHNYQGFSTGEPSSYAPVRFKESHPDYMQFVVRTPKDRK